VVVPLGRIEQVATRAPGRSVALGRAASRHGVDDTHLPELWTRVTFDDCARRLGHGRDGAARA